MEGKVLQTGISVEGAKIMIRQGEGIHVERAVGWGNLS